jgi:hypothetical protein
MDTGPRQMLERRLSRGYPHGLGARGVYLASITTDLKTLAPELLKRDSYSKK